MALAKVQTRRDKRPYVPGERWRERRLLQFTGLPRALRYDLQNLEPRMLLAAQPLYDPQDGTTGPPIPLPVPGDASVKTNIRDNLKQLFDRLATLGDRLAKDGIVNETAVPFFQKSVNDLIGKSLSDFFKGGTGSNAYAQTILDYFATSSPTTDGLATALQTDLNNTFGSGIGTVTDASTSTQMKLNFSIDLASALRDLQLGGEAQEFYLTLDGNTQVSFNTAAVTFSIVTDLTGIDNVTTAVSDASANKDKYWVEFAGANKDTVSLTGSTSQTLNTDLGVGFGLIGARESTAATEAGGHVASTTGSFNFSLDVDFTILDASDGKLTLTELNTINTANNWSSEYSVSTAGTNTGTLFLPIAIANPAGDAFISGIQGVGGNFTLTDTNLFDSKVPLVQASSTTLASFSRMTVDDLLQMARNASYIIAQTQNLEEMQAMLPFLDLSLGEAYGFAEALEKAFLDPITYKENVLTFKDVPGYTGSSTAVNYTGSASFNLFIYNNGVLLGGGAQTVTVASDGTRTTAAQVLAALENALPTISGTKYVHARLSQGPNPRLELYGADGVTFFVENVTGTLNLGIDPYGLVFSRNTANLTTAGTIGNPPSGLGKYQLPELQHKSTAAIVLSDFSSARTFTLSRNGGAAVTVTLPPGSYTTINDLVFALQKAVADASLYNVNTGAGIVVSSLAVGGGWGVRFTDTVVANSSPVVAGTDAASIFKIGTGANSNQSTSGIRLSNFDAPLSLTITMDSQKNGTLTTGTATTITIPADNYASIDALISAIRSALKANGLYNDVLNTGVLVKQAAVSGGLGIQLYGSADVTKITLAGSDLAKLNLAAGTSSAHSLTLTITSNGVTTTPTIYLNGNTTTSLLGSANSNVNDFVSDLHDALVRAGVLDPVNQTGVDIRALAGSGGSVTDTLEFFALNPGLGAGLISAISTTSTATSASLDRFGLEGRASHNVAFSTERQTPNFANIQEFTERLKNATGVPKIKVRSNTAGDGVTLSAWTGNTTSLQFSGAAAAKLKLPAGTGTSLSSNGAVLLSDFSGGTTASRTLAVSVNGATAVNVVIPAASYATMDALADAISKALRDAGITESLLSSAPVYDGSNPSSPFFTFPVRLFVDEYFAGGGLADLTDVDLAFQTSYGSTATGQINNLTANDQTTVSRSADLTFDLRLNLVQPQAAAESLRVELPIMSQTWAGQLDDYDAMFKIILDDGIERSVTITVAETSAFDSIQDFVDLINTKLAAISLGGGVDLADKVTASLDTVNEADYEVLRFITTAGASRSLTVRVPEYMSGEVLKVNEAADKLGFTTNVTTSQAPDFLSVSGGPSGTGVATSFLPANPNLNIAYRVSLFGSSPTKTLVFRTLATATSGNSTIANMVSDLNAAITAAGLGSHFEAYDTGSQVGFRTKGSTYTSFALDIGKSVYLGSGTGTTDSPFTPIIAESNINTSVNFKFDTEAFFTFQLPDGTASVLQVEAASTDDNADLNDLIEDINNAILGTTDLMQAGVFPKVIAYNASGKLAFKLNTTEVFLQGGNWNLQVDSQYTDAKSNAASYQLMMEPQTRGDSQYAIIGMLSKPLTAADTILPAGHDFKVDISINGTAYKTITVTAASTSANTGIGDLIADINAALMSVDTAISNGSGGFYKVGQYIKAISLGGAEVIQLMVLDNAPGNGVFNVRFDATDGVSNNGYVDLGFQAEESRIGIRGSDALLENMKLLGRATVQNGSVSGSGAFGFVQFNYGASDLDVVAESELTISGVTRMVDLMRAFGSYRAEYSALTVALDIKDDTAASFRMTGLSFPPDPVTGETVDGLQFVSSPFIQLAYRPNVEGVASSIGVGGSSFANLPPALLTFDNTSASGGAVKTADLAKLARVDFQDISFALWRVGDFLSDWMNNDPNGPFASNLFFAKTGLVDVQDFGKKFGQTMLRLAVNPPETLQEVQRALASGLQLDPSEVTVQLVTSGSGSTFNASLKIAFELISTFSAALPLYVDLAALSNRTTNSGLVKQSLLGLSSLSGNPADPMEVELTGLSKLNLDMDLKLVEAGTVIEPKAVLNKPASGEFFETKFFLTGDSYTGELPAGANRLRLGYSWLSNEGKEVLAPGNVNQPVNVTVATTGPLGGTYDGATGTFSGTGTLVIDGLTLEAGTGSTQGDTILVMNQADARQNGLYYVSAVNSSGGGTWTIARLDSALDWTRVTVNGGSKNAGQVFMIKGIPSVDVAQSTLAAVNGTYTDYTTNADPSDDHFLPLLEATANGALLINGTAVQTGDFVLLMNQGAGRNGVYQVANAGSASSKWQLVQMEIGEATLGMAHVLGGANAGADYYVDNNAITLKASSSTLPYNVVQLRPSAVAVSEGGEIALPDVNGTPSMYDLDEVTLDEAGIPAAVSVRASTTGGLNGTFSTTSQGRITGNSNGTLTVDGITLALNDLVLVNHQADASQNGIYKVTTAGGSGAAWVLTRENAFDSITELATARIKVLQGTQYGNREFKQSQTLSELNASPVRFSKLIKPASFAINLSNFNSTTSKVLPYTVRTATTAALSNVTYDGSAGTITATQYGSINSYQTSAWDAISGQTITFRGIDGMTNLSVGDRILVKDQGRTVLDPSASSYSSYQGNSQNGIYEIVSLGSSTTAWQLKRVDFADIAAEFKELRVAVLDGRYNYDTRYIQTLGNLPPAPAGIGTLSLNFSNDVPFVYGNYDVNGNLVSSWAVFSADGNVAAHLPLSAVIVPSVGGETEITKDLASLTDTEKKALGQLGSSLIQDDLYLSMPDLPPLRIFIADDTVLGSDGFIGSGLEKFFKTSDIAVTFDPLPDLARTIPPSDVLSLLRDWAFVGDALDLALFTLQFGMDQALGIEVPLLGTSLPKYTGFIEEFRDDLTTRIRNNLREDPLKPANAIRDALYEALGPNGMGYLTAVTQITVKTGGTTWNIDNQADTTFYGTTPEGLKFEKVSASNIEFSFDIVRALDTDATAIGIDTIDIGDASLGITISSQNEVKNATTGAVTRTVGGIQLKRAFEMHFGFGMDIFDGFYIFNPTQTSGTSTPAKDMVKVTVEAQLDGDIHTDGIQDFVQSSYVSQVQQMKMSVADGRKDYATDGKASGYFGTYAFNLNTQAVQNRVGANDRGASVDQIRSNEVLGPGATAGNLFDFVINADADIDLMIETERAGLIPSYQANIIIGKRFGSGYGGLTFDAKIAGLGNEALGQKIIDNTASADEKAKASPDWRVTRSMLTANGKQGSTFIAFQNITIDVQSYLSGPLYTTLSYFNAGIEKLRPFLKFMTSPIPGTEWMATPIIMGDLFGNKFKMFISVVNTLDRLLGTVASYAAFTTRTTNRPRVTLGGSYNGFEQDLYNSFDPKGPNPAFDKYKAARDQAFETAENKRLLNELPKIANDDEKDAGDEEKKSALRRFGDSLKETANTPNKFSEKFEKFRDGDVDWLKNNDKPAGLGDSFKNALKSSFRDALKRNDDRGGRSNINVGVSGGGFQLDALLVGTALKLFQGQEADLLRVSMPKLLVGYSYTRFFPLPAFPPLGMTLGMQVSVYIQLSFGFDNRGFYWTNKDTNALTMADSRRIPAFGFTMRFSVGVALNLGLIEVGVQAYLELGVEFFWNTAEGTDKLRQREIDWLWNEGNSLFDVRVYGKVGVTIYVDITIPLVFTTIYARLFQLDFSVFLFDETINSPSGHILLATQTGDTLRLNMGRYATDRLFIDVDDISEVFHVYSVDTDGSANGEDVIVAYYGNNRTYYSRYNNVKHLLGYTGNGQTAIDAGGTQSGVNITLEEGGSYSGNLSALKYATVNFFGADGSTFLRAAGASTYGKSRLDGGQSTASLDASATTGGITLIAGKGNSVLKGGSGADILISNEGSDKLYGNASTGSTTGNDTYYFLSNFGRDRIFATGTGNTVSFDNPTLTGFSAGDATYTLPSHNDGAKFQFGPLVQSAKIGSNTVFYAVDPTGANSIDTWVGTAGNDQFNVFHFAPSKTLNLVSNGGSDFYNVFLGDPKKVYNKNASANQGTVTIDDSEGTGRLLLTQTFADSITYTSTSVTNGRERMTLSGLERIDLNAGDSTLYWGNAASPSTYQDIVGGSITTGRIILVGNVSLTGTNDVVLNLLRTFKVDYNLNVQNGNSGDWRDLYINIENPNPALESNLNIGPTGGIFISQGTNTSGNGYGVVYINTPTGSVQNLNDQSGGIIRVDNGYIEIRARKSIGSVSSSLQVRSQRIAASTSSPINVSGLDGIYLYSPVDLNVRASQNLNGISTVNGSIRLEVATGFKLTYGNISAGGAKNITLIADDIELAGAYSFTRTTTTTSMQDVTKTRYEYQWQWIQHTGYSYYFGGLFTFGFFAVPYQFWTYEQVLVAITYTVKEPVTTTTTATTPVAAGVGSIKGTGQLTILNQSDSYNIRIGDNAETSDTSTLFLTKAMLDSLATTFSLVTVGRSKDDTRKTRQITAQAYAFGDSLLLRGQKIDVGTAGQTLSSAGNLQLEAYTGGSFAGQITFVATGSYTAQSIYAYSDADLTAQGTFTSNATQDGLLYFQAGAFDGTGSVTLSGTFNAASNGSDMQVVTGTTSGDITISASTVFNINDLVTLDANKGTITQSGSSGRITVNRLEVLASGPITVFTNIQTLVNAVIDGDGALVINELDALTVTNARTKNGDITITTGGNLLIDTIMAGVANPLLVVAADLDNLILNSGGTIVELANDAAIEIYAKKLTADSKGNIDLDTQVSQIDLEAKPTGLNTGNIVLVNNALGGAALLVTQAVADNGLIDLTSDTAMIATLVKTNNVASLATNTIALTVEGDLTAGQITTGGYADVTLDVDGLIKKAASGTSLVTGQELFVIVDVNATSGTNAVNLAVDVDELNVDAQGSGNITVTSATDLIARDVESAGGGSIFLTVTDATASPSLSVERIAAGSGDITLSVKGSILDLDTVLNTKITGDDLIVTSGGTTQLDTAVNTLDVQVGGTGSLRLDEVDGIDLKRATTNNGNMTLTIGVAGLSDGSAYLGEVRAGAAGGDDITLTTHGGAVLTLSSAATKLVSADLLTLTTATGVGIGTTDTTAANYDPLRTKINTLVASSTLNGVINILETDSLLLSDLDVADGSIYVIAGGTITHDAVTAYDDAILPDTSVIPTSNIDLRTAAGSILALNSTSRLDGQNLILRASGDIEVRTTAGTLDALISGNNSVDRLLQVIEDDDLDVLSAVSTYADMEFVIGGDLNVRKIDATQSYDVTIDVEGAITKTAPSSGSFNLRSNILIIDSLNGIDLVTAVNSFDVESEASGDFIFNNLNAATIEKLHTYNGSINFTNNGNLTADSVQAGTGSSFDDDLAFDVNNGFFKKQDSNSIIRGHELVADVDGEVDLETRLSILDLQTHAAGNVIIDEFDGLAVDQIETFNGSILLDADGDVLATLIKSDTSSAANTITINLNDAVNFASDLTVTQIDGGTNGSIVDLNIQGVVGNTNGATSLITADWLYVDTWGTAANAVNLRSRVNNLTLQTHDAGDVRFTETGSIRLRSVLIDDGNFYLDASGSITHDTVTTQTAGRDTFWTAGASVFHGTGKVTTDLLQIDAVNSVTVDTTVNTLDVDISATGALVVTETNDLIVRNVTTNNGDVTMTVGEYDALNSLITSAGNLQIKHLKAGASNQNDVTLTVYGFVEDTSDATAPALQGDHLLLNAWGYVDLTTDLTSIDAETFAAGRFHLVETDDLTINDLTVLNGPTTLNIGTSLVVQNADLNGTLDLDTGTSADINTIWVAGNADIDLGTHLLGLVDGDFDGTLDLTTGAGTGTAGTANITTIDVVGATVFVIEESLTLGTGTFHNTFDLTTGTFASITTINVTGNADIDLGTNLTLGTGDFDGTLTLDTGVATGTAGTAGITTIDVVGATVFVIEESLTLDTGTFHNTFDLTTGTFANITTINVTGNADIDLGTNLTLGTGDFDGTLTLDTGVATGTAGTAGITTIDVVGATIFVIEESLTLGTGTFHNTFDLTTGTFANITTINVTGNADIDLGTNLTLGTGDFDGTLTLDTGVATGTAGTAGITTIDVAGAATFVIEESLTVQTGDFHNTFTLDTGTSASFGDVEVAGVADFEHGTSLLITKGVFHSTLDVLAGTFVTFTELDGFDDLTVDAGTDITATDVDIDSGSIYFTSTGGDITLTLVVADSANEEVILDAFSDIFVTTLTLDGSTGFVDMDAQNGYIQQTAGKITADTLLAEAALGITGLTEINTLTAFISGAAGDITYREDTSLTIVQVLTPSGTFDLDVGGRIDVSASTALPTPHVTANEMILTTANGIALITGYLNAYADVIDAFATVSGGIYINNLKGVEFRQVYAEDGEIRLRAAGDTLATDVRINVDDDSKDLILTTTNGGDVTINYIGVGDSVGTPGGMAPFFGDVVIDSDGAINGVAPGDQIEAVHVLADTITYIAETGIGNLYIPLVTGRVLSATTTTGDMNLGAVTTNPFHFVDSSTGDGNISFTQGGPGDLVANHISSGNGSVTIRSIAGGDLDANQITSNHGDVNLLNQGGGDQTTTHVTANHGNVTQTVQNGGDLDVTDTQATDGDINLVNQGGGDQTVDDVNTYNGNINSSVNQGGDLDLSDVHAENGNVTANVSGGGTTNAQDISTEDGGISLTNTGGGGQTVDGLFTQNGSISLRVGQGARLTVFDTTSQGGNTTFTSDSMSFLGGGGSINGTGTFTIQTFSPGTQVHILSPFNGTPYDSPNVLEIGARELAAIGSGFSDVLIGNPFNADLTFQTFWELPGAYNPYDGLMGEEDGEETPDYVRLSDLLVPGGDENPGDGEFEETLHFQLTRTHGRFNLDDLDEADLEASPQQPQDQGNASGGHGQEHAPAGGPHAFHPQSPTGGMWALGALVTVPLAAGVRTAQRAKKAARQLSSFLGSFL
jgi:hypothetical protein